jgi:hypothetical protein
MDHHNGGDSALPSQRTSPFNLTDNVFFSKLTMESFNNANAYKVSKRASGCWKVGNPCLKRHREVMRGQRNWLKAPSPPPKKLVKSFDETHIIVHQFQRMHLN